ncbi:MAG: chromate efflux transporter [Chloroflexi bacterium AL-W]|nr:chromate efflux transporter [Chloroflexi bacterium AL-N1]NOK69267.1 chromate efflux transporter [Chloroflexi bacterium AL-N10]NOK76328.1 chromate efflux transporter [Chloroflexi bacterium AL-N5]NOK83445.1 chromate efflux transporter [Chloroflexi bacterium AL-W]NOK91105.1 chromate efflux transporter [Chloroflexi bacterium AL-N15]
MTERELPAPPETALGEVARLFLRLGFTAFGGPAAHIAMMREEIVKQRKWIDDQRFLDLLGATNLIPGPNSTELAIHLGYVRAGWRGLIVAGVCFIGPAMLIVMALAALYVQYGTTPAAGWLLYGITPVIMAIILQALWGLTKTAVKGPLTAIVGVAALALYFTVFGNIAILLASGLVVMLVVNARRLLQANAAWLVLPGAGSSSFLTSLTNNVVENFSLWQLFLQFLKIGSVLYGSGYVLLAFLRADFVERLGWLTDQQLLDAIAIGQFTPGPVFTTATFIGYILGGVPGAVVATVGIFLPSFIFVAISNPIIPRLRNSPWAGALLDGVNVASLGLMAAVSWELGRASIIDPFTAVLAIASLFILLRFKINSVWLIIGGAVLGVGYQWLVGMG